MSNGSIVSNKSVISFSKQTNVQMSNVPNSDEEMDDTDLLSGRWCGHVEGGQPGTATPAAADPPHTVPPPPATAHADPATNNQVNTSTFIMPGTPSYITNTEGTEPPSQVGYGTSSYISNTGSLSEQDPGAFGRGYIQCRSARIQSTTSPAVECSTGRDFGKLIPVQHEKVGNLNLAGDRDLEKTFRGSRVTSKGDVVNQVISLSFDPATLMCTVCKKEHSIIPSDDSELAIMVSDQNFVPALSGRSSCVPVIRMEDPTLKELFEICVEILDRYSLPNGTLFLVGSLSHLCEMGSTIFSLDWIRMVKDFNHRWKHVKVGPLPPVLREATSATTTKVLAEIWTWFKEMYGTSINFPARAWDRAITALADNTEQNLDLANREVYKIALPISLTSTALTHRKFTASSCHPQTSAFGDVTTDELLHALLHQLSSNFGCNAHPEDILAREPAELEGAMDTESTRTGLIIVGGGSNCKRLATTLKEKGVDLVDLTVPGWTPTASNISKLRQDISNLNPDQDSLFICDLMSNVCFGFEQLTGSLALPVKSGGTYHMYGKVTVNSKDSTHHVLEKLLPVFGAVPGLKIVLPPLPRYMFSPCCGDPSHCEDIGNASYAAELLEKTVVLRKTLRDFLHARVSNVWVPDTVSKLSGNHTSITSQVEGLRTVFANDGVHLSAEGADEYSRIVKGIIDEKIAAPIRVSGGGKPREYFWRGFVSPHGSSRPNNMSAVHHNRQPGGGKWRGPSTGSRTGSGTGPRPGGWGGRSYPPPLCWSAQLVLLKTMLKI